jgi:hypothetical protein
MDETVSADAPEKKSLRKNILWLLLPATMLLSVSQAWLSVWSHHLIFPIIFVVLITVSIVLPLIQPMKEAHCWLKIKFPFYRTLTSNEQDGSPSLVKFVFVLLMLGALFEVMRRAPTELYSASIDIIERDREYLLIRQYELDSLYPAEQRIFYALRKKAAERAKQQGGILSLFDHDKYKFVIEPSEFNSDDYALWESIKARKLPPDEMGYWDKLLKEEDKARQEEEARHARDGE